MANEIADWTASGYQLTTFRVSPALRGGAGYNVSDFVWADGPNAATRRWVGFGVATWKCRYITYRVLWKVYPGGHFLYIEWSNPGTRLNHFFRHYKIEKKRLGVFFKDLS